MSGERGGGGSGGGGGGGEGTGRTGGEIEGTGNLSTLPSKQLRRKSVSFTGDETFQARIVRARLAGVRVSIWILPGSQFSCHDPAHFSPCTWSLGAWFCISCGGPALLP